MNVSGAPPAGVAPVIVDHLENGIVESSPECFASKTEMSSPVKKCIEESDQGQVNFSEPKCNFYFLWRS